jgi:transposase
VTHPDPQARITSLERELAWANLKIQSLMEELRQFRVKLLGPKSETLNNLQLELLADEEPGATLDEVEAETKWEPLTVAPTRERKPHPGRQPLPENLPRVEEIVRCSDPACRQCGAEKAIIGYDESEQLDVEPARYFVRVIKREKRACRCCEKGGVTMAPVAPRIVEKGLASDRIVVETVVAKYADHLPLYRQAVILEREAGLEIGRATLDGWVMRVGNCWNRWWRPCDGICCEPATCKRTKRSCQCRCTINAVPTTRRTCGNTEDREAKRFSTSAWGEGVRGRRSSSGHGKASYKPMGIRPTKASAGRNSCTSDAGRMPGVSLLTPSR